MKYVIIFLSFVLGFFICFLITPKQKDSSDVLKYLDSIEKIQSVLNFKLDSLHLLKKEQLNVYYKTKLTYDTLKITIDTMPPLDGTKLLLSKSRQLTNKGIE